MRSTRSTLKRKKATFKRENEIRVPLFENFQKIKVGNKSGFLLFKIVRDKTQDKKNC